MRIDSNKAFRLSLDDLKPLTKSDGLQKEYKIYFSLLNGEELLDNKIFYMMLGSNVAVSWKNPDLEKGIGEEKYGFKVTIEDIYIEKSFPTVIVRVQQPGFYHSNVNIDAPVIDLFCGSSTIFKISNPLEEGYDEKVAIPFEWGDCEEIVAHLRNGNDPMIYASDTYKMN